jgi:hypothetical protein
MHEPARVVHSVRGVRACTGLVAQVVAGRATAQPRGRRGLHSDSRTKHGHPRFLEHCRERRLRGTTPRRAGAAESRAYGCASRFRDRRGSDAARLRDSDSIVVRRGSGDHARPQLETFHQLRRCDGSTLSSLSKCRTSMYHSQRMSLPGPLPQENAEHAGALPCSREKAPARDPAVVPRSFLVPTSR